MNVKVLLGTHKASGATVAGIKAPYEAKDIIKAYVPAGNRTWLPQYKMWEVWYEPHVTSVMGALRRYGYVLDVDDQRTKAEPPHPQLTADWATKMFAALPPELHSKAYRALVKVIHPDAGGDTEAMQDLAYAFEAKAQVS